MATPEKTIVREALAIRLVWMLIFLLAWYVTVPLLGLLVVAQLLFRVFMGAPSGAFMSFGDSLSQYLAQIGRFAAFNTDAKPWPVADWPTARPAEGQQAYTPAEKETQSPVAPAAASTAVATPVSTPDATVAEIAEVAEVAEIAEIAEVAEQAPDITDPADSALKDTGTTDESKP